MTPPSARTRRRRWLGFASIASITATTALIGIPAGAATGHVKVRDPYGAQLAVTARQHHMSALDSGDGGGEEDEIAEGADQSGDDIGEDVFAPGFGFLPEHRGEQVDQRAGSVECIALLIQRQLDGRDLRLPVPASCRRVRPAEQGIEVRDRGSDVAYRRVRTADCFRHAPPAFRSR